MLLREDETDGIGLVKYYLEGISHTDTLYAEEYYKVLKVDIIDEV